MKWRSLEEATPGSETRSLAEVFVERKELIAKYVPPEIQAIHARVITELGQSGITERALQPGAVLGPWKSVPSPTTWLTEVIPAAWTWAARSANLALTLAG